MGEAAAALHAAANAAVSATPADEGFRSPYSSKSLPRLLHVTPLREVRELVLLFPAPPVRDAYRRDPSALCSHLLGHEAEGSPLAVLQDRGWATALTAGLRVEDAAFCILSVKVSLTSEGERQWRAVFELVLEHSSLIRAMSETEVAHHWAECVELSALDFEYLQKSSPYVWAPSHSRRLALYRPQHVLSAGLLFDPTMDYRAARAWTTRSLQRDNCMVLLVSQASPAGQPQLPPPQPHHTQPTEQTAGAPRRRMRKDLPPWESQALCGPECCAQDAQVHTASEEWYGVDFTCAPLPPAPPNAERSGLRLPAPNQFIPRDKMLRAPPSTPLHDWPPPPSLLANGPMGQLWHSIDRRYGLPRVQIHLLLHSAHLSHGERALARLHGSLLTQLLKRRTYDAEVAGLSESISLSARGAELQVSGYSQHAPRLLALLLEALLLGGPREPIAGEAFGAVRERSEQRIRNRRIEPPSSQALSWQELLLGAGEWRTIEADLADVSGATLEALRDFHDRWRAALFASTFVCGNVCKATCPSCILHARAPLSRRGLLACVAQMSEDEALACHEATLATCATRSSCRVPDAPFLRDCGRATFLIPLAAASLLHVPQEALPPVEACAHTHAHEWCYRRLRNHGVAPLPSTSRSTSARARLPVGAQYEIHAPVGSAEERNSSVVVYLQAGVLTEAEKAALRVLCSLLREPCFRELRTVQQIGMLVCDRCGS
jgi:secreted Zn-dependent insulinase-like peptidase